MRMVAGTALVLPTISIATPAELSAVAQLQLDTFDPAPPPAPPSNNPFASLLGGSVESPAARAQRVERLTEELRERVAKGSDIYIARGKLGEADEALLGAVDLSEQEMQSPFHAIAEGLYLSSMVVALDTRRQGIGRRLLEAAERRATSRDAECVWLFVEASNEAAVKLYVSSGFTQQADSPRHTTFATALELRQREPLLFRKSMEAS